MKNCLVFLDQGAASPARLEFGIELAAQLEAHLTAVALSLEPPYLFAGSAMAAQELWIQHAEARREDARLLAEKTEERLERTGKPFDLRWACLAAGAASHVAAVNARYADLSIIGSPRDETQFAVEREIFDGALFDSGRPVLVTPEKAEAKKALSRVMIAWDSSKHSARAVGAAMPLLTQADEVAVVVVNPEISTDAHGQEPGGDIALALARHGLKVAVHRIEGERKVGDALASHASEWGAGMIVMGGFGHSQFRESILGGVSRDLLARSAWPLFMAH